MSHLISAQSLTRSVGTKRLFSGIDFTVEEGDKVGLVGHNGSGKTSLLRLLNGSEDPDSGEVIRRRGLRMETVEQFLPASLAGIDVHDAVLQRLPEKERAERAYQANIVIDALGISKREHELRVGDLSGGQQNRLMFARAIVGEPELVLFDEPTNHLDLATLEVFERYLLEELKSAFVLISHDREFLDAVTRRTLILRDEALYHFDMPYSAARYALLQNDIAAAASRHAEEKRLKTLRASAKRLATWGKVFDNEKFARRAKSMEKRVARLEAQQTFVTRGSGLRLNLDVGDTRANRVLQVKQLRVYPPAAEKRVDPLFEVETLTIRPGERIALLGANGVGKTSFISKLVEHYRSGDQDTTHIAFSPQTMLGYYDQELNEVDQGRTMADYLRRSTQAGEKEIRAGLIRGGFAYADHARPIRVLSGGERARVLFVSLRLNAPNFFILDEPTNHIDIEGREQLEDQLRESGATLLITSHDRRFIDNIAERFLTIEAGVLNEVSDPGAFYARLKDRADSDNKGITRESTEPVVVQPRAPEDILERIVALEQKLAEDLARKKKHQKPQLQAVWREEIKKLNEYL